MVLTLHTCVLETFFVSSIPCMFCLEFHLFFHFTMFLWNQFKSFNFLSICYFISLVSLTSFSSLDIAIIPAFHTRFLWYYSIYLPYHLLLYFTLFCDSITIITQCFLWYYYIYFNIIFASNFITFFDDITTSTYHNNCSFIWLCLCVVNKSTVTKDCYFLSLRLLDVLYHYNCFTICFL
jgi:hypothetical protein